MTQEVDVLDILNYLKTLDNKKLERFNQLFLTNQLDVISQWKTEQNFNPQVGDVYLDENIGYFYITAYNSFDFTTHVVYEDLTTHVFKTDTEFIENFKYTAKKVGYIDMEELSQVFKNAIQPI